jgi:hypothetical protein
VYGNTLMQSSKGPLPSRVVRVSPVVSRDLPYHFDRLSPEEQQRISGLDAAGAATLAQQVRKVKSEHREPGIDDPEVAHFYVLEGSGSLDGTSKDFVLSSW